MAFEKTHVELETLTRELAEKFAAMQPMPGERERKHSRLAFFQNHIKEKTFVSPTWSIGIHRSTGAEYRLDGQHSSYTLAHLPEDEFPENLTVTIQKYTFDSLDQDAYGLFDLFDHPKSARTNEDIMGVHQAHYPDLDNLSRRFLVKTTNGIEYFEKEIVKNGTVLPARQHGAYFSNEKYREFALWLVEFQGTEHEWMINYKALVGEMLADWEHSAELASEFWSYVFKESHPDPDDDTRELSRTLKEWTAKPKYKPNQFRKKANRTWERFRKNRERDLGLSRTGPTYRSYDVAATNEPSNQLSI
ncbi:MAG TPA: hypothetical protein VI585_00140 [Candidatus Binatia bacterium]